MQEAFNNGIIVAKAAAASVADTLTNQVRGQDSPPRIRGGAAILP